MANRLATALPVILALPLALSACSTPDQPVRLPAAVTITHPADGRSDLAIDTEAEGICRQWGRGASVVERYENESRNSKVSAYTCVAG
ncbi:hypothetical protein N825_21280 [Skermanella stibiiresistens SB22]|uniref:Uncharacterized protein n=1 Tax=Skermanella stibiiresistens SB22 TaxID=1385369 RepID=W9H080_9PROT|nr:hypothetical protein [Skermanella stibiiresistens]EWY37123.1 hypothetical protein N825_21280 [Skermanella stibiiresistens SB22]